MTTAPFTAIKFEKDNQLILVKADIVKNKELSGKYLGLSAIDGVDINNIIALAKERAAMKQAHGGWLAGLPSEMGAYIRELNPSSAYAGGDDGVTCTLELEDPDSHEIDEYECKCTIDNLMEAVNDYDEPETPAQSGVYYDNEEENPYGAYQQRGGANQPGFGGDDDDMDPEELAKRQAYMKKRQTMEHVGNAFATAVHLAQEMGLSLDQIENAWTNVGGEILTDEQLDAIKEKEQAANGHAGMQAGMGMGGPGGEMPPEMAAMMGAAMGGMGGPPGAGGEGGGQQCPQQ